MTTEATAPEGTEGTVVEDVKTEATATYARCVRDEI